jgi:hypothetical protein
MSFRACIVTELIGATLFIFMVRALYRLLNAVNQTHASLPKDDVGSVCVQAEEERRRIFEYRLVEWGGKQASELLCGGKTWQCGREGGGLERPWGFTNQGFLFTLWMAPKARSDCHLDL